MRNSIEEQKELCALARQGDQKAKAALLKATTGLIQRTAHAFFRKSFGQVEIDDLVQAGNEGVLEAITRYDPEKGAFSTFSVWWIRARMFDVIYAQQDISKSLRYQIGPVGRRYDAIVDELGHEAASALIAKERKLAPKAVAAVLRRRIIGVPTSLDQQDEGFSSLYDRIADVSSADAEAKVIEANLHEVLQESLEALWAECDEREKEIITKRILLPSKDQVTLLEIGNRYGLSRERIRQIEAQLRRALQDRLKRAYRV